MVCCPENVLCCLYANECVYNFGRFHAHVDSFYERVCFIELLSLFILYCSISFEKKIYINKNENHFNRVYHVFWIVRKKIIEIEKKCKIESIVKSRKCRSLLVISCAYLSFVYLIQSNYNQSNWNGQFVGDNDHRERIPVKNI